MSIPSSLDLSTNSLAWVTLTSLVYSSVLGFPRMGKLRDLKKATEAYWGEKISRDELLAEGKRLRLAHWKIQKDAGVDIIPSNDFAFYDQVLDHIQMFGVSGYSLVSHINRLSSCLFLILLPQLGYPREIQQVQPPPR